MSKGEWITLLVVAMCTAFALGVAIGGLRTRGAEMVAEGPGAGSESRLRRSEEVRALLAARRSLRSDLASKDRKILELETELAELREKSFAPLGPGQKKWQDARRRWARKEKVWKKIFQWRDKAARQEGLEELAALLQSNDAEDLLVGWSTLYRAREYVPGPEKFKPQFLRAVKHEDPAVRLAALECGGLFCSGDEIRDIVFSLARDPSPWVRRKMVDRLVWYRRQPGERSEEAASLYNELLQDEDAGVKDRARYVVVLRGSDAEAENMLMELSRDPASAGVVQKWASRASRISERLAQRLVELYDEQPGGYGALEWTKRKLSDDAKPIASGLCMRILRDSIEPEERRQVLDALERVGDSSVVPELMTIAASEDAEGIEEELARTIERLQRIANQPR